MEMRVKYLNTYNLQKSMGFSLTPIIMFILLIWEIAVFPKKQGTATILLHEYLIFHYCECRENRYTKTEIHF